MHDRAVAALAAWLNGSDHEVENHVYVAARLILDRLDRDELLRDAIELEATVILTADEPVDDPATLKCRANQEAIGARRVMFCGRCGHATNNQSQGHWWAICRVTGTVRAMHYCCPDACELEDGPEPDPVAPCHPDPATWQGLELPNELTSEKADGSLGIELEASDEVGLAAPPWRRGGDG